MANLTVAKTHGWLHPDTGGELHQLRRTGFRDPVKLKVHPLSSCLRRIDFGGDVHVLWNLEILMNAETAEDVNGGNIENLGSPNEN